MGCVSNYSYSLLQRGFMGPMRLVSQQMTMLLFMGCVHVDKFRNLLRRRAKFRKCRFWTWFSRIFSGACLRRAQVRFFSDGSASSYTTPLNGAGFFFLNIGWWWFKCRLSGICRRSANSISAKRIWGANDVRNWREKKIREGKPGLNF